MLAVDKLYQQETTMRDNQIKELEIIADVISYYDTSNCTAAEAVEYYESQENMPEWYDDHDRGLLTRMVHKLIK